LLLLLGAASLVLANPDQPLGAVVLESMCSTITEAVVSRLELAVGPVARHLTPLLAFSGRLWSKNFWILGKILAKYKLNMSDHKLVKTGISAHFYREAKLMAAIPFALIGFAGRPAGAHATALFCDPLSLAFV